MGSGLEFFLFQWGFQLGFALRRKGKDYDDDDDDFNE